ncbi:MAG: hypothetical protein F6K36_30080 [Symploca sp. SIO3C6]|nr:hypothetical protein [Symploca sp. SIO3C6]
MTVNSEDNTNDNQLGQSVAIADGKIIAGAYDNQSWYNDDGPAYVFDASPISIGGIPEVGNFLYFNISNLVDAD